MTGREAPTPLGPFRRREWDWQGPALAVPALRGATVRLGLDAGDVDGALPPAPDLLAALGRFLALPPEAADEIVPHLWAEYAETFEATDITLVIPGPEQVWDHVRPRFATATRDDGGVPHVSVEAASGWDEEHGLQLVLRDGTRWVRVSDYSGHLTEGASWGAPALDAWIADPAAALPIWTWGQIQALRDAGG